MKQEYWDDIKKRMIQAFEELKKELDSDYPTKKTNEKYITAIFGYDHDDCMNTYEQYKEQIDSPVIMIHLLSDEIMSLTDTKLQDVYFTNRFNDNPEKMKILVEVIKNCFILQ